jgi:hypothetical protein
MTQATWVVNWQETEGRHLAPGTSMLPRSKERAFDTSAAAVSFAMSLPVGYRGSIQLHIPGGQIAEFPSIERMHEAQKLADNK